MMKSQPNSRGRGDAEGLREAKAKFPPEATTPHDRLTASLPSAVQNQRQYNMLR